MRIEVFINELAKLDANHFYGVPDSQLKALCNYLNKNYSVSERHVMAANEGNCVAMAAGYHLATGKIPVVYMQNSGLGNIVNPVASLLHPKVYAIPCIFVVGWRGEPGVHDEPQHAFQGEATLRMLADLEIETFVLTENTTEEELKTAAATFSQPLKEGKCVAFVVRKGALEYNEKVPYKNQYALVREDIIKHIIDVTAEDVIVSTTGKTSRELFEIREARKQSHKYDFLTVGSMGHSSSIALGIAQAKPQKRVWCLDGDGAALMHMGAMAVIASVAPKNLVHVVINNNAYESVGGMPTATAKADLVKIAQACGYPCAYKAETMEELDAVLENVKDYQELTFIEIKSAIGSRADLGRPTTTPQQNKEAFMNFIKG